MITWEKLLEVERLLAEERYSLREIAERAGVCRATVSTIARGKRPVYEARRRTQIADEEPLCPPERCPGCGGMVYLPCQLCQLRQSLHAETAYLRQARKDARQESLRRLLQAVWKASQQRDEAEAAATGAPVANRGRPESPAVH